MGPPLSTAPGRRAEETTIDQPPQVPRGTVAILAALAALGGAQLGAPLNSDTALFHVGARHLLDGAVLYRDWWDLKGPGVYLVHLLAATIDPVGGLGLHLLALLGLLLVAATLPPHLRGALTRPRLAALAGLLAVAPYYLAATPWHLSQPAVFAGIALYGGYRGVMSRRTAVAALGGVALGMAVAIKLSALLPAVGLLAAGYALTRRAAGVLAGLGGAVAASVAALWWTGGLDGLWWTFTHWREAAADVHGGIYPGRLLASTSWFAGRYAGVIALAGVGGWLALRSRDWRWILALVWAVAGYAGVLLERFGGWPFDLLLLSIPLGILAIGGVDALCTWAVARGGSPRRVAALAVAAVLLPASTSLLDRLGPDPTSVWGDRDIRETAELLHAEEPGSLYVFGDPKHLLDADRAMATSVHGWAWEVQPPSMWRRVLAELQAAPPRYVLVERQYEELIRERHPPLWAWLHGAYRPAWRSGAGVLYALQDGADVTAATEVRRPPRL